MFAHITLAQENMSQIERMNARKKLTETEKIFSNILYNRDVDSKGIGKIRSIGDKALFGGFTTKEMKQRMGINQNKPLADYLPTVSITAKNLASEMTIVNTKNKDLRTEMPIAKEHAGNNASVRGVLKKRGIIPERLPAEEDIKKIERKHKTDLERLENKGTIN